MPSLQRNSQHFCLLTTIAQNKPMLHCEIYLATCLGKLKNEIHYKLQVATSNDFKTIHAIAVEIKQTSPNST